MEQFDTVADFLENVRFRQWLKAPDTDNTLYWNNWLKSNPSKKDLFENALAAYLVLEGESPDLSNDAISERVLKIKENLPDEYTKTAWWRRSEFSWAAILLFGIGTGWFFWLQESDLTPVSIVKTEMPAKEAEKSHRVVVKNTEDKAMLINLPDRSSVLLAKNSQLEYLNDSISFRREVSLKGEAFFEIVKIPDQPFYVHTASLTTKVLGTSFLVRSFDGEARAIVRVRTGKVEVTPRNTEETGITPLPSSKTSPPLLLLPNEQASLLVQTHKFIRDVQAREYVEEKPMLFDLKQFEFRFTPVPEIFKILEKTYETRIVYDAEKFKNCTLTASLTDEPFLEKLRLICIGTEASFEISDNEIIISGPGCK